MDLQLRVMGEDSASAAFQSVGSAARATMQVLVDFTKDSVKAYMESERVQRQLSLVAKDLSGSFQLQAQRMAEANAVSDESVMQLQTMLLRYGEAPSKVEATTQAILDYAAATGTDATSATSALTRGVEAGNGYIKALGVSYEVTGDKTKDLAAATAALAAKYGGASGQEANSLTGQVRAASEAFGELQETFGGFISEIGKDTGALEKVTQLLRDLAAGAAATRDFVSRGGVSGLVASAKAILTGENIEGSKLQLAMAQSGTITGMVGDRMSAADEPNRLARADAARTELTRKAQREAEAAARKAARASAAFETKRAQNGDPSKLSEHDFIDDGDDWLKQAKASAQKAKEATEKHFREMQQAAKQAAAKLQQEHQEFARAGAALGSAFASSLTNAIEQLATGGEQDVGKVIANIVAAMLQAGGAFVGNLLLPGVGGVIGGALGGLAGAGVRAAANGPPTVNIKTFDSRSTREFFENEGGRGLYNSARTGRGWQG